MSKTKVERNSTILCTAIGNPVPSKFNFTCSKVDNDGRTFSSELRQTKTKVAYLRIKFYKSGAYECVCVASASIYIITFVANWTGIVTVNRGQLKEVEKKIFGKLNPDDEYLKITESINSLNSLVNTTVIGKPGLESLFARIKELDKDLEFSHVETQALSMETKLNLILPMKKILLEQASALEKVESMCDVLGSEHIKGLQSSLYSLSKIHLQQEEQVDQLSQDTTALISHYNSLISLLSLQFTRWNNSLLQLEALCDEDREKGEEIKDEYVDGGDENEGKLE
ncbi:hypothetical protein HELRODRAFT_170743 [Helobdella robusta]|uniref:Uncharacterized protein n=1 Tax=Helobdella robusta TaxID=6412 RepID=T1F3D7_HELRO|nr:hypothetical protein HELRODRAFT_170743 [Helobdella robusta]ESO07409.1 hypothetical protein HELRODRAFT_170743 [Helobdella robusta]